MFSDLPHVAIRISARLEAIELVATLTGAWLHSLGLARGSCDDLLLAVREAVANAVQHGAGLDPRRVVEVELERRNNQALIRVVDDGGGFEIEDVPDPLAPENLLRPTGRGLLLMKALADEVEFFFGGGTEVVMRKTLGNDDQDLTEEEE